MKIWTTLLALTLVGLLGLSVSAEEKKDAPKKRASAEERFAQMDTDSNKNVSEAEFVASMKKMPAEKAKEIYKKMGGCPKNGLTLEQYKKAREEWAKKRAEQNKDKK